MGRKLTHDVSISFSKVLRGPLFPADSGPVTEILNGLRVTSLLKGRICRARGRCPAVSLSSRLWFSGL
jgi:hypothetical protein